MQSFESSLPQAIVKRLQKRNIFTPTAIQSSGFEAVESGEDVYLYAETGSGKTLAYLLPLLQKLDTKSEHLQILILAPSHELASQIHQEVLSFQDAYEPKLKAQLILGETPTKRQIEHLKRKPQIITGTSGRILDLIELKKLKIHKISTIVIDEADLLLVQPNLKTVEKIIKSSMKDRQLCFASASKNTACTDFASKLCPDLKWVDANPSGINHNIVHAWYPCPKEQKIEGLHDLIKACKPEKAMIFVHHQSTVGFVASKLKKKYKVIELSGTQKKDERIKALKDIRSGKAQILVTTDIAARGIDIDGISHIIQFDLANRSTNYLHRAGRTARAGNTGGCISIVAPNEERIIKDYCKELNIQIENLLS